MEYTSTLNLIERETRLIEIQKIEGNKRQILDICSSCETIKKFIKCTFSNRK